LAEDDKKDTKGSFGYELETGQCVRPKEGNGDCGDSTEDDTTPKDTGKTTVDGEGLATLAAILSIFAL